MMVDLQETYKVSESLKNEVLKSQGKIVARTPRKSSIDDYRRNETHSRSRRKTKTIFSDNKLGKALMTTIRTTVRRRSRITKRINPISRISTRRAVHDTR